MAKQRKRQWTKWLGLAIVAALLVAGWRFYRQARATDVAAAPGLTAESDRFFRVQEGDFEILVLVDGTVDAIERHELKTESRKHFPLTLISCVEDNSHVEAGDIVMECQPDKFIERIEEIEKNLEDNLKDIDLKDDQLVIANSTNVSTLKAAVDKLRNARDALQKYRDLDARKTRNDQASAIEKAEADLEAAEADLAEAEEARRAVQGDDDKAVASADGKVATAQKAVDTAQSALDTALHNQRVQRQYKHPQELRSLEQAVEQADLDLRRQTMEAGSRIFQLERDITNLRTRRRRLQDDLKNFRADLAGLVIRAPIAGIVNLGNVNRPHWQQPKEWKVGTEINTREIVASIPDLSKFLVKCQIPEEHRSRIRLDQPARCRSTAIPDLLMVGRLGKIEPVAVNLVRWDQNSPKVYPSQIFTDTTDSRLMPGMSVKVELIVDEVKGVLFVPVEAVYNRSGTAYVRVRQGNASEERVVTTGRSSLSHVEITSGLQAGEEVLLINASFDAPP